MPKRILVCDDDEGILDMLSTLLETYGFEITVEKNSLHVDELITRLNPDLLLVDLWMPVLSGDQVVKNIRANPLIMSLPVIVFSASKEGQSIAMASGADDYIAKPFNISSLVEKINAAVN